MIRPPPKSTRTDTLFPYTTLFRSTPRADWLCAHESAAPFNLALRLCPSLSLLASAARRRCAAGSQTVGERVHSQRPDTIEARRLHIGWLRKVRCECTRTACSSEESRVGTECVSTVRSRWSP